MNNHFSSSGEVFSWLSQFINLERGQKPKSFRLDRMETLAELADCPERCAPSIHVAGSKGKGSVTSILASVLKAAGFRTARYMSPHVIDIRERICLGDSYFDEDIYITAGNELRHITETLLPAAVNSQPLTAALFDPAAKDSCEPTFWELLTLLFFLCARNGNCDMMTVETGMGGRLDSTNVLDPLVSVITLIELEHTEILGNTITAIAGEKAGIIKPGKPLVLTRQNDSSALGVFRKKAAELNSPLLYLPDIAELSGVKVTAQGTDFTLNFKNVENVESSMQPLFPAPMSLSIPVPGKIQAENAALAIAAVKTAIPQITEDDIRKGLANLNIPARFENITSSSADKNMPPVIIDGAHTPESLAHCVDTFCSLYGEGGILLFGCAADKDAAAMARTAHARFSKIIITTPGNFKISDPAQVYEAFANIAGRQKTELIKDTQEAIKRTLELADAKNNHGRHLPVLGTGSFYLVSEIRKFTAMQI